MGVDMKVSQVIEFLEAMKGEYGDIKLESITGFWIHTVPATDEKIIVPSVGDGRSVKDLLSV